MAHKTFIRKAGEHRSDALTTGDVLQSVTGSIVFETNTLAVRGVGSAVSVINSVATTNQAVDLPDTSGVVDVTP